MFKMTAQILTAIDNPLEVGGIILAGIVVFLYLLVVLKYGGLWLQGKLSGADVSVTELIGMTLRKVNTRTVVVSRITAVRAGLSVSTRQLEVHYLSGGRVPNVVKALITADRANIDLSFETAAAIDLAGRDVLAEVQAEAKDHVENLRAGQEQAT